MRVRLGHGCITAVERMRHIIAVTAIMMVGHVSAHISLIVVQINGFRLGVVIRPITIVIRRRPNSIRRACEHIPHRRTLDKYRPYYIIRTIQPTVAYYLHIQRIRTMLSHQSCYILKYGRRQTGLNKHRVIRPSVCLYHAQIINPPVAIEVEVVNHVTAGVEQLLKLAHVLRLRKSGCHGIKVQIERHIRVVIRYSDGRHRSVLGSRCRNGRRINGLHRRHILSYRSHSADTGPATRQAQRYKR